MLNENVKQQLLRRIPKVELSYDRTLHNKVQADIYMIIPKGPKAFMWVTYIHGKNACVIAELGHNRNIKTVNIYNMCFDDDLALGDSGTLIFGTIFTIDKNVYFSCENLHYFKGDCVTKMTLQKKISLFKIIFSTYIKQVTYGKNFIIPGIPVCKSSYEEAMDEVKTLPYLIYGIQHHALNERNKTLGIRTIQEKNNAEGNFIVKATIDDDIYDLYCYNMDNPYGTAMIPNYKSSVMMNKLFRNIRENFNLDLLEESEDEGEFENTSSDKFVNLDKKINMKCVYIHRFRKWQPIEVIHGKTRLITEKEALFFERK